MSYFNLGGKEERRVLSEFSRCFLHCYREVTCVEVESIRPARLCYLKVRSS